MNDTRSAVYQDLHHNQLQKQEEANRFSAELILAELFRHFQPKSLLDVGCGIGTWLAAAQRLGVADFRGIEGEWLDRKLAQVTEQAILNIDLEKPFDLGRRFDLVICLEVAEHLSPAAAAAFVESLARHSDVVLFSAAIPHQGGHHHVNEQFLDYWDRLFGQLGYRPVDFLRPLIWNDRAVLWWLRQNIVVFAREGLATGDGPFARLAERAGPLSIVHPDVYLSRLTSALATLEEHHKLMALLSSGNTFSVVRQPNGQITISRMS
jgi:SAM-dependent methyltransferase